MRRKRFGDSRRRHRGQIDSIAKDLERESEEARADIRGGNCGVSVVPLLRAAKLYGKMRAHFEAGGSPSNPHTAGDALSKKIRNAIAYYENAVSHFDMACEVKAKPNAGSSFQGYRKRRRR
jgi:hypothetical protein